MKNLSLVYMYKFEKHFLFGWLIFFLISLNPGMCAEHITLELNDISIVAQPGETISFRGIITNRTGHDINAKEIFTNFYGFSNNIVTLKQLPSLDMVTLPVNTYSSEIDIFELSISPNIQTSNTYTFDVSLEDSRNNISNTARVEVRVEGQSQQGGGGGGTINLFIIFIAVFIIALRTRRQTRHHNHNGLGR